MKTPLRDRRMGTRSLYDVRSQRTSMSGGEKRMYVPVRRLVLSFGIAAAGVVLAGTSHWWLAPLLGDTPPVRLLLVLTVMAAAWLGGLWPGLFATVLGLLAIVAANDAPGDLPSLLNRSVRFGSLALLITGSFTGIHAFRHRAQMREQQLRRSERRYRRLVETAGEGIWVFEPDGSTSYANPRLGEMLGVPAEELIGRPLAEFLVDSSSAPESWSDIASGATARELRLRARDGTVRDVVATARAIGQDELPADGTSSAPAQGSRGGILLMVTDVTERKLAEEELRKAKEVAEAACQGRDRFLAVLSHELRTPLTPVLFGVSSLLEENPGPALRPTLEMIRRNIELEARLIDDLLDLSRFSRGRMRLEYEIIDIHETIKRAIEICRDETFLAGLEVVTELTAAHHHASVDDARLLQIFWNLIRNAVKFTPANGRLTIRTANIRASALDAEEPTEWIVVEFEDTGIGIDASVLPRIFKAFEQYHEDLRSRSGGLGLGLAISRSLAKAFGGRLTASSAGRGCGSTFRLELATVPAPVVRAPERPALASSGSRSDSAGSSSVRILLVDDNADTLRYLSTVLKRRGHEVVTADSVAAARTAVNDAGAPFDLLLSDIDLPDGDGMALMRELNARSRIPGIALSGFGTEEDCRLTREAGFVEHLTKPIDMPSLDAAIKRATASAVVERPPDAHAELNGAK
jgi:PAS domain S-box-containing protein